MNSDNIQPDVEGFVTLHIPSRYSFLRIVRQSLCDLCIHSGLSAFKTSQLEMALDEGCSQIIANNIATAAEQMGLRVNIIQDSDCVITEIYHYGEPIELAGDESVPEKISANMATSDLALYVIKRFVDKCEYQIDHENGHCLKLIQQL